jgi:hypothetical protein
VSEAKARERFLHKKAYVRRKKHVKEYDIDSVKMKFSKWAIEFYIKIH